ncbi:unnamed protein product [Allacma fusca]|uniref:Uncharacterized protein n=1 Tax=Allacma fusca TaxID=39272 RepID=A0A8J2JVZ9_9HEXA|nr:unnamed protein product [Allacma fusca]
MKQVDVQASFGRISEGSLGVNKKVLLNSPFAKVFESGLEAVPQFVENSGGSSFEDVEAANSSLGGYLETGLEEVAFITLSENSAGSMVSQKDVVAIVTWTLSTAWNPI